MMSMYVYDVLVALLCAGALGVQHEDACECSQLLKCGANMRVGVNESVSQLQCRCSVVDVCARAS